MKLKHIEARLERLYQRSIKPPRTCKRHVASPRSRRDGNEIRHAVEGSLPTRRDPFASPA